MLSDKLLQARNTSAKPAESRATSDLVAGAIDEATR
jgi:hypothetical protein